MENTSSEEEKSHLPRVLRLKILRQDKQNCEGLLYCYLKLSGILLTPLIQRAYDIQHRDFGKETKLHALLFRISSKLDCICRHYFFLFLSKLFKKVNSRNNQYESVNKYQWYIEFISLFINSLFQHLWVQLVRHPTLDLLQAACRAHHSCIPWCNSPWCHLVGCTRVGHLESLPHHRPLYHPSSPHPRGITHRLEKD